MNLLRDVYGIAAGRSCLLLVGVLVSGISSAEESDTLNEVEDLRYGVTLYHFYQQRYFDALTELSAAQKLEQLPHHGQQAELLRGGISLSYGMDNVAGDIFKQLLVQAPPNVDADRAWFYLGKLAWQRGDIAVSGEALAKMAPDYTGEVADEGNYLQAIQALTRGEEDLGNTLMARVGGNCPWQLYYDYNLGAARAAAGDWQNSAEYFRRIDGLECNTQEGRALRDKSHAAAGFANLAQGEPGPAAMDFQKVRLDGPESDRALLGYGWSQANQDDYLGALSPWQRLAEYSLMSASARESLLAVPYAYERLGRPLLALQHYQHATNSYTAELARLRQVTETMRQGDLLTLFGLDPGFDNADQQDWFSVGDILPQGSHASYLRHLISTDGVQLALRELRDINAIELQLQSASQRLQVLDQVDREQQRSWDGVLTGERLTQLQERREAVTLRLLQVRQQLSQASENNDGRAIADAAQAARWQRLERAEHRAQQMGNTDAAQSLALMRGLLSWQDSENFPDRQWRLQEDVADLESLAQQMELGFSNVVQASAAHTQLQFAGRISTLQQRTQAQQAVVSKVSQQAESQLRQVVVQELQQQDQHLSRSLGQSHLAVARLYDQGSKAVPR